jgi:transcriptional regulator with XRE-family HTH domain
MEGDLQRLLGANLRSRRLAEGLSQEAFADVLGIHRTYVGGLERGERNVTLRTVERFADRLGISPESLLQPPGGRRPLAARRRA